MKEERRKRVPKKISSVSHPTRQGILDALREEEQTTLQLEEKLEENRYNLYHHLEVLEKQGIIEKQTQKDSKMKVYKLRKGSSPIVLALDNLPQHKHLTFKNLLNKLLVLWNEKPIESVDSIDEVLIVPSTEKK